MTHLAGAKIEIHRLLSGHEDKDELRDEAESHDPDVDEHVPEVVLEVKRIFEVKDKEVAREDDPVDEQHRLDVEHVLDDDVEVADLDGQRAVEVAHDVERDDDDVQLGAGPAQRRQQPVHQDPLLVRPELLVPDDSVTGRDEYEHRDEGDGDAARLGRPVLKGGLEEVARTVLVRLQQHGAHGHSLLRKLFVHETEV